MKYQRLFMCSFCLTSLLVLLLPTVALGAPTPQGARATPPLVTPEPPKWEDRRTATGIEVFEASRVRQLITDLPTEASVDEIDLALFDLLPQIFRAKSRDMPVVAEVVASLRRQPDSPEAIVEHYHQLPVNAFRQRLVLIGILGELKRPDALRHLRDVVWKPLPAPDSRPEGLSARDLEEMIQAKAVQGVAYLSTPEADRAVREVILDHEALHVRVSAIDAYMWNHGDSPATAAELYRILPSELHLYVERPRFYRGMDTEQFSRQLRDWREKWHRDVPTTPITEDDDGGTE